VPKVRELSLFTGMSEEHFDEMLQMAYLQRFPPQVQLITEGDQADFLHIVVDGTVEMFGTSNGRETTMAILRPISTFILAAVLKDAVYLMSARTLNRAQILMIPAENIRAAMEIDPAFARAMVLELASGFRSVVKTLKEQKLRTAVERLANYLLRALEQRGAEGELELTEDKRTLAALMGMTPENLSRAFGTLKDYGVEVHGSRIKLTRIEDLTRLAKPTPLIDHRSI